MYLPRLRSPDTDPALPPLASSSSTLAGLRSPWTMPAARRKRSSEEPGWPRGAQEVRRDRQREPPQPPSPASLPPSVQAGHGKAIPVGWPPGASGRPLRPSAQLHDTLRVVPVAQVERYCSAGNLNARSSSASAAAEAPAGMPRHLTATGPARRGRRRGGKRRGTEASSCLHR